MKLFRLNIILISIALFISSCEGLLDEENNEQGKYSFWSNFDGPPIDIYVDNDFYGSISTFYASNPGCEADGCVTVTLPPGIYDFEAIEQPGNTGSQREWDGTIEIKANVCSTLGLSP
jgi:hypothetical protein